MAKNYHFTLELRILFLVYCMGILRRAITHLIFRIFLNLNLDVLGANQIALIGIFDVTMKYLI